MTSELLALILAAGPGVGDLVPPREPMQIVGGEDAQTCEWPAAVALVDSFGNPFCTGSLLHPEAVLTAAHCITAVPTDAVVFGENAFAPQRTVPVTDCEIYPEYWVDARYDLAVCRLSQPVTDVPIVPPLMGCEANVLKAGKKVTIVGFGASYAEIDPESGEATNAEGVGTKRHVDLTVEKIDGVDLFLLGDDQTNACFGDSGGPVYVKLGDGTWRVAGAARELHPETPYTGMGNVCFYGVIYTLEHTEMTWIESAAGVELTPCHDPDGTWNPGPDCEGFPSDIAGGGTWAQGCGEIDDSGLGHTCGAPFDQGSETGTSSGGEETSGTTGAPDDTGPVDPDTTTSTTGPAPLPPPPADTDTDTDTDTDPGLDDGKGDGCGCRTDTPQSLWAAFLFISVLGTSRRRRQEPLASQSIAAQPKH